jgi:anaerobic dimethyl sulfoxide reductase subunit B (iron-sulfur subunit)
MTQPEKQLGFYIDITRCFGCHTCVVACKSENNTPISEDFHTYKTSLNYRWVIQNDNGGFPNPARWFVSMGCFHCEQPACQAACPVEGAIIKRFEDGIVLIDQDRCIGCRRCEFTCPYGALQINFETQKVEKCTFCVHLVDAGLEPACVSACPGLALQFGDMADIGAMPAVVDRIEAFADPALTTPNVRFRT